MSFRSRQGALFGRRLIAKWWVLVLPSIIFLIPSVTVFFKNSQLVTDKVVRYKRRFLKLWEGPNRALPGTEDLTARLRQRKTQLSLPSPLLDQLAFNAPMRPSQSVWNRRYNLQEKTRKLQLDFQRRRSYDEEDDFHYEDLDEISESEGQSEEYESGYCRDNPLVEEFGTSCRALARETRHFGCTKKLGVLIKEFGGDVSALPVPLHDVRVAEACQETCGYCDECAPGCEVRLLGNSVCEPECNVPACHNDLADCWQIHCETTEWGPLGPCSIECDPEAPNGVGGMQRRSRRIITEPKRGGTPCGDLVEEVLGCNKGVPCPQYCEVSPWGPWSPCSAKCGTGHSTRQRVITVPAKYGAPPCPTLSQQRPCYLTTCPKACDVSEWTSWSPCSTLCGEGFQMRTRTVLTPPVGSGETCGPLSEIRVCEGTLCDNDLRTICALTEWNDTESRCSASCGGGTKRRRRSYVMSEDERTSRLAAANGECPTDVMLEENMPCNTHPCDEDCVVGNWSEWGPCDAACGNGYRRRDRPILRSPVGLGAPCPGDKSLVQEEPCHAEALCEAPCQVSEWEPWSECQLPAKANCGVGDRFRYRNITQFPTGSDCPHLTESEPCFVPCGSVNETERLECTGDIWGAWEACSTRCGLGTTRRARSYVSRTSPSGSANVTTEMCGVIEHVAQCLAQEGCIKNETEELIEDAPAMETSCPISDWSVWSACTETCGNFGFRKRTRAVDLSLLGKPGVIFGNCPPLVEYEDCNREPCERGCVLSEWSRWSSCTLDCGEAGQGHEYRTRTILAFPYPPGTPCPPSGTSLVERRPCRNLKQCESRACNYGEWTEWSPCDKPCGMGSQRRQRQTVGGQLEETPGCSRANLVQERPCFVKPCDVDCVVSPWSFWGPCDVQCGGGSRARYRNVTQLPLNDGKPCPHLVEYENCNEKDCYEPKNQGSLADCQVSEWSEWSSCSKECGGGVHQRSRSIVRRALTGGEPCPELVQKRGCNLQRCEGSPCEDRNEELGVLRVNCEMLLNLGCEKNLKEEAAAHKLSYPDDLPPEARVKDACPVSCNACKECAPGCQMRDVGNTVCTPECNVEECSYDLGDCDNGCKIPSPLSPTIQVVPRATGVKLGENVTVTCQDETMRFKSAPELSSIVLFCREDDEGSSTDAKKLVVEGDLFTAFGKDVDFQSKLSLIKCAPDPCPFIVIQGFAATESDSNSTSAGSPSFFQKSLNGLYERAPTRNGRPHYVQNSRSVMLHSSSREALSDKPLKPKHFWTDMQLESLQKLLTMTQSGVFSTSIPYPMKNAFVWKIGDSFSEENSKPVSSEEEEPGELYVNVEGEVPSLLSGKAPLEAWAFSSCKSPAPGMAVNLSVCLPPNSLWFLFGAGFVPTLSKYVEARCIESSERDVLLSKIDMELLQRERGGGGDAELPSNLFDDQGRPLTMVKLPNMADAQAVYCDDRPEVKEMAGIECGALKSMCDKELRGLRSDLPDWIPDKATIGHVCPRTCGLCETCAPGCPLWFKRNGYCDLNCKNPACENDGGDCDRGAGETRGQGQQGSGQQAGRVFEDNKPITCQADFADIKRAVGLSCDELIEAAVAQKRATAEQFRTQTHPCLVNLTRLAEAVRPGPLLPVLGSTRSHLRLVDVCYTTCGCCTNNCTAALDNSNAALANQGDCVDDPRVEASSVSCPLIVHAARQKFPGKGCSVSLIELARSMGQEHNLPSGVSRTTRVLDACPFSCDCCECPRLKSVSKERLAQLLKEMKISNCIDDKRIESISKLTCGDIVDLLDGNCDLALGSFGLELPADVPPSMTLRDACGVACGQCPRCEDQNFMLEQLAGVNCTTLLDVFQYRCTQQLRELMPDSPSQIPALATLQHVCPESCAICPKPPEGVVLAGSSNVLPNRHCEDHPGIGLIGSSCASLLQHSEYDCGRTLQSLDVNPLHLPPDLDPLTSIGDACPTTCGRCEAAGIPAGPDVVLPNHRRCADSPLVEKYNQTCATLIKVGDIGCATVLRELVPQGSMNLQFLSNDIRISTVCKKSCGRCLDPPSCFDNYENGEERGVDCGGPCRPCKPCSPTALKALGEAYVQTGWGVSHRDNRTLQCRSPTYSRRSGSEPTTLFCEDGTFTKPRLICGEDILHVQKGTLKLIDGQHLGPSAMASLHEALRVALELPIAGGMSGGYQYLRFSEVGVCQDLAAVDTQSATFVCQDDAAVEKAGFDCAFLSRLGCDKRLAALAQEQQQPLPPSVPVEATIADACPVSCNACAAAAQRLREYQAHLTLLNVHQSETSEGAEADQEALKVTRDETERGCLQINFIVHIPHPPDNTAGIRLEDSLGFNPPAPVNGILKTKDARRYRASVFSKTLATQLRLNQIRVVLVPTEQSADAVTAGVLKEPEAIDAYTLLFKKLKAYAYLSSLSDQQIPLSQWKSFYAPEATGTGHPSAFMTSGIPSPVVSRQSAFSVPFKDPNTGAVFIGRMVRSIPGTSSASAYISHLNGKATASVPTSPDFFAVSSLGILTGWYDTSAAAAPIAPIVGYVRGKCSGRALAMANLHSNEHPNCCTLRTHFEKFLKTACGRLLYDRRVSKAEMNAFCLGGGQAQDQRIENGAVSSCYEQALELLDRYGAREEPACDLLPLLYTVVTVWCSKDGIADILLSPPDERQKAPFCFLSLKETLRKRLDLLSIGAFSDAAMADMCRKDSCMRLHLRYIDSLTQLQLAWHFLPFQDTATLSVSRHNNGQSSFTTPSYHRWNFYGRRFLLPGEFLQHIRRAEKATRRWLSDGVRMVKRSLRYFSNIEQDWRILQSSRGAPRKQALSAPSFSFLNPKDRHYGPSTLGSFLGDSPEHFLDFVCHKVKGEFCQKTLLLLTGEDPMQNPTSLREPCGTPCFVPMMGYLGGLLEAFGYRQGNPRYKALGVIFKHYGRFYCTFSFERNRYCGTVLFSHDVSEFNSGPAKTALLHHRKAIPATELQTCTCSAAYINDGQCDLECFNANCAWDGDDCRVYTMFPELFFRLAAPFLTPQAAYEADPFSANGALSRCLFYDSEFFCSPTCRELYRRAVERDQCCFIASLETLGALLKVEMQHPDVAKSNRWQTDRTLYFLEQQCSASMDRTCTRPGEEREYLHVAVAFQRLTIPDRLISDYSSHSLVQHRRGTTLESKFSFGPENSKASSVTANYLRQALSQTLQIVESDMPRIVFRPNNPSDVVGFVADIQIDAGYEIQRVKAMLENPEKRAEITWLLSRRAPSLYDTILRVERQSEKNHGASVHQDHGLPSVQFSSIFDAIGRSPLNRPVFIKKAIQTPRTSFKSLPSTPYVGTFGMGIDQRMKPEGCFLHDLLLLGAAYELVDTINSEHYANHGERHRFKCATGMRMSNISPTVHDVFICDNGAWRKENGLRCGAPCVISRYKEEISSYDYLYPAAPVTHEILSRREMSTWSMAYEIVEKDFAIMNTTAAHGTQTKVRCAPGYTSSQGRQPTSTICLDSRWSPVSLVCTKKCLPYNETKNEGYVVLKGNPNSVKPGTELLVGCAAGYFPASTFDGTTDTTEVQVATQCDATGSWTPLSILCIKPGTIDPRAGPSMFQKLVKQVVTGPGLIGIIVVLFLTVMVIIGITLYWQFYYRPKAKKHAQEYDARLQQAARLNAARVASQNINSSVSPKWTDDTSALMPQEIFRSEKELDDTQKSNILDASMFESDSVDCMTDTFYFNGSLSTFRSQQVASSGGGPQSSQSPVLKVALRQDTITEGHCQSISGQFLDLDRPHSGMSSTYTESTPVGVIPYLSQEPPTLVWEEETQLTPRNDREQENTPQRFRPPVSAVFQLTSGNSNNPYYPRLLGRRYCPTTSANDFQETTSPRHSGSRNE